MQDYFTPMRCLLPLVRISVNWKWPPLKVGVHSILLYHVPKALFFLQSKNIFEWISFSTVSILKDMAWASVSSVPINFCICQNIYTYSNYIKFFKALFYRNYSAKVNIRQNCINANFCLLVFNWRMPLKIIFVQIF